MCKSCEHLLSTYYVHHTARSGGHKGVKSVASALLLRGAGTHEALPVTASSQPQSLIRQESANLVCKEPDRKYFWLCRPYGLCRNYSTLPSIAGTLRGQYVNNSVAEFQYLQKPASARFDLVDCGLQTPVLKALSLRQLHKIPQFLEKKRRGTLRSSTRGETCSYGLPEARPYPCKERPSPGASVWGSRRPGFEFCHLTMGP